MKKTSYYLGATVTSYTYLKQPGFIGFSNIFLGASKSRDYLTNVRKIAQII